ncbi:host-nuclease inhibitor Gam family protein [Caloramator sp. CAR-1]|uniref:host-nuclease inhibitor Gam family protein n=1 Tax=Caloramator sp. CAR-1 TaxID=3062777 RepID=UPI0026E4632F|nr:host-nuclease inhibitor Gam family protein [Caloramator sp. CAR-1]MDO6353978.1 host-nuclease inhibitor Gam family protein [Caloramator sp. CAR-1]
MELRLSDVFLPEGETQQEGFKVDSDLKADWCLDKIREANAEYNRFEMVVNAKIEQLQQALRKAQEKRDREVGFFEAKLREYFETVQAKETKTQKSYTLPSGKLVLKYQQPEFKRDEDTLLNWVENNKPQYVKIKKSVDWSSLKKTVKVVNGMVIDSETGEVIEGVTVEEREPKFIVEVE